MDVHIGVAIIYLFDQVIQCRTRKRSDQIICCGRALDQNAAQCDPRIWDEWSISVSERRNQARLSD